MQRLQADKPYLCDQYSSLAVTSPSVMRHIRRYFWDGIMPPNGTVCDVEDSFFGSPKQAIHVATSKDKGIVDATRLISHRFHELRALNGYLL